MNRKLSWIITVILLIGSFNLFGQSMPRDPRKLRGFDLEGKYVIAFADEDSIWDQLDLLVNGDIMEVTYMPATDEYDHGYMLTIVHDNRLVRIASSYNYDNGKDLYFKIFAMEIKLYLVDPLFEDIKSFIFSEDPSLEEIVDYDNTIIFHFFYGTYMGSTEIGFLAIKI